MTDAASGAALRGAVDLSALRNRPAEPPAGAAAGRAGRGGPLARDGRHGRDVPAGARALPHRPRGHRPVGRVVRSVQAAHPGAREGRRRGRRTPGARQGRRRRQPAALAGVPRAVHPDGRRPGRRPARAAVHRRRARAAGARGARPAAAARRAERRDGHRRGRAAASRGADAGPRPPSRRCRRCTPRRTTPSRPATIRARSPPTSRRSPRIPGTPTRARVSGRCGCSTASRAPTCRRRALPRPPSPPASSAAPGRGSGPRRRPRRGRVRPAARPLRGAARRRARPVRERLLELFALVGDTDPRVIRARGRLASLLF